MSSEAVKEEAAPIAPATPDPETASAPAPAAEPATVPPSITDNVEPVGHVSSEALEATTTSPSVTPATIAPNSTPSPTQLSLTPVASTLAPPSAPVAIPDLPPVSSFPNRARSASALPPDSDADSLYGDLLPRPSPYLSSSPSWLAGGNPTMPRSMTGTASVGSGSLPGTLSGLNRVASLGDFKPSPHRMETEIAQLRAQLERTESILKSTQEQHSRDLRTAQSELHSLRSESGHLKRHAGSLESTLATLRDREAEREREVQKALEELRGSLAKQGSELVAAKSELERQRERATLAAGEAEKQKRINEDITHILRTRDSDLESARARLHQAESELLKAKEDAERWTEEKRHFEQQVERTSLSLAQHTHLLSDAHEQLQATLSDVHALREGNRDLSLALEETRSQVARLKSESEASEEGARMSRNLSGQRQEAIEKENEKLKAEVARLTTETQGHSDVLRKEKAEHLAALRAVQLQLENQAATNQLLKRRVEEHTTDMERMSRELQDTHDRHRTTAESHATVIAEHQSEHGKLRDRINELSIDNQGLLARGDKLAEELLQIKRDFATATENFRTELSGAKREARALESKVAALERDLADTEANARAATERLEKTSTDHTRTVTESTEMAKTVARLNEVNNGLKGEIARLRGEFEEKSRLQTEEWTKARINLNLALETEQKEKKKLLEQVTTLQTQMKHLQDNHETAVLTQRSLFENKEQLHLDSVREVAQLTKEKATLEETVRSLEAQIVQLGDSAKVAQDKATKTLETNRQHVKRIEEDVARTQRELAQSQKEVAEVRGQMKEHLRQHEMATRDLTKQLHEANQGITHWKEQAKAHEQFIEKVKGQLSEMESQTYMPFDTMSSEGFAALKSSIQSYKPKSAAGNGVTEAESVKLRKELNEVAKERDRLARELSGMQDTLAAARSERSALQEQVVVTPKQVHKPDSSAQSTSGKSSKGLFFFRANFTDEDGVGPQKPRTPNSRIHPSAMHQRQKTPPAASGGPSSSFESVLPSPPPTGTTSTPDGSPRATSEFKRTVNKQRSMVSFRDTTQDLDDDDGQELATPNGTKTVVRKSSYGNFSQPLTGSQRLLRMQSYQDFKPGGSSKDRVETEVLALRAQLDRTEGILKTTQEQHERQLNAATTELAHLRTTNSRLKERNAELETTVADLRSGHADAHTTYRSVIEEHKSTIAAHKSEAQTFRQESERLKQAAQMALAEAEKHKQLHEELNQHVKSSTLTLEQLRDKLHRTEQELAQHKTHTDGFEEERQKYEAELEMANEALEKQDALLESAHQEIASLHDQVAQANAERKSFADQNDALRAQVTKAKADAAASEDSRRTALKNMVKQDENSNLRIQTLVQENMQIKEAMNRIQEESMHNVEVMRKEKTDLAHVILTLQLQLEAAAKGNQALKRKLEDQAVDFERMQRDVQDIHEKHARTLDTHVSTHAETQSENARLRDRINELTAETDGLRLSYRKVTEELAQQKSNAATAAEGLRAQILTLKEENRALTSRNSHLEREIVHAEENSRAAMLRVEKASTETTRSVNDSSHLQKEINRLTEINNGLKAEIYRVSRDFEAKSEAHKKELDEWNNARIDIDLRLDLENKEKKKLLDLNSKLQSQIKHLQENHESALSEQMYEVERREQMNKDSAREIAQLTRDKAILEEQLRVLETQAAHVSENSRHAQEKWAIALETSRTNFRRLEEELLRIRRELTQTQRENEDFRKVLKEQTREQESTGRALAIQLKESNQLVAFWKDLAKSHEGFIEKIKGDVQNMNPSTPDADHLDNLASAIQSYKPRSASTDTNSANGMNEVARLRGEINELVRDRERLLSENAGMRDALSVVKAERNALDEQLRQTQSPSAGATRDREMKKAGFFFRKTGTK
ncbi:hypothetical protein HDU93_000797 [Gonapodya sp. JEL0774]|nr:hypothetical protein HDU93_000797 [Gonapodya sp. JEL0774]